jgi:transcriptional regulator with XRE-family HTH domain
MLIAQVGNSRLGAVVLRGPLHSHLRMTEKLRSSSDEPCGVQGCGSCADDTQSHGLGGRDPPDEPRFCGFGTRPNMLFYLNYETDPMKTLGVGDIGRRLKAHRMGRGQTADEIAEKLGISRAAVYRIESGGIVKIETLERLASELGTSLSSLLGVSIEYHSNAVSYFERMRQIEEQSDQVVAHFPPISYLLTSDQYPIHLKQMLIESLPSYIDNNKKAVREIDAVIAILEERKRARRLRRLSVVNFVTIPEIERWLKLGVVGRFDLSERELAMRRVAARAEVENLMNLVEGEPMGIQIALLEHTLPNITFQLFRNKDRIHLGLSPFRLGGELPNIRLGLAMVTAEAQAVELYEKLAEDLWRHAHKGRDAVRLLRAALDRSGISRAQAATAARVVASKRRAARA